MNGLYLNEQPKKREDSTPEELFEQESMEGWGKCTRECDGDPCPETDNLNACRHRWAYSARVVQTKSEEEKEKEKEEEKKKKKKELDDGQTMSSTVKRSLIPKAFFLTDSASAFPEP
jgi:hypothetical protein